MKKVFGTDNPIGQNVVDKDTVYQVIGVVGDIKSRTLGEDARPVLFRSLDQSIEKDPAFMGYTVMVRSSSDPAAIVGMVRNQVKALDPSIAVFNVQTMQEHLRDALFLPRLAAMLFGVFGFIGLVLASVGLYGAMNYSVSQRTREIGIRMALGAQISSAQRLFVRKGMLLTLVAVVIGVPASLALARLFTSVLYGGASERSGDFRDSATLPVRSRAGCLLASGTAGLASGSSDGASCGVKPLFCVVANDPELLRALSRHAHVASMAIRHGSSSPLGHSGGQTL